MFKKIDFKKLNYGDLDSLDSHDLKRDEMHSFYQTFDFLDLIKKWPEIVGTKLAPVTSPLKIKIDTLYVVTPHSAYTQELSFSVEMIKVKIYEIFPQLKPIIKKIAFQTQANFFNQKQQAEQVKQQTAIPKLHPQSPKYKLLKAEADRLFGEIEDVELKNLLISLFMQQ